MPKANLNKKTFAVACWAASAFWGYGLTLLLNGAGSVFFAAACGVLWTFAFGATAKPEPKALGPLFLGGLAAMAVGFVPIADVYTQSLMHLYAAFLLMPLSLGVSAGWGGAFLSEKDNPRAVDRLFACLWAIYTLWLLWMSWMSHENLGTHSNFSHLLFNLGQGRATVTLTDRYVPLHFLGWHLFPNWLFLAPVYRVFPMDFMPGFLQTLSVAVGVWPIYLFARKRLPTASLPLGIALGYMTCLIVPLALLRYVTDRSMSIAFCSWMFYFLWQRQTRAFWICCLLFLGWGEGNVFVTAPLGIYLIARRQTRLGGSVLAVSVAYFWLAQRLGASLNHGVYLYAGLQKHASVLLSDPQYFAQNFINPQTLVIVAVIVMSGSYFCLFEPLTLVALPLVGLNMLSEMTRDLATGYGYLPVIPIMGFAAVLGTERVLKKFSPSKTIFRSGPALIALHLCAFTVLSAGTYLDIYFGQRFALPLRTVHLKTIVDTIPREASVASTSLFEAYLGNRREIYEFPAGNVQEDFRRAMNLHYDNEATRDADYVVVDVSDAWLPHFEKNQAFKDLLNDRHYGLWKYDAGLLIFKRGFNGDLGSAVRVQDATVARAASAEALTLVEARISPESAEKNSQIRVDYLWRLNRKPEKPLWVVSEFQRDDLASQQYRHREVHAPLYGLLQRADLQPGQVFRDSQYFQLPASMLVRRSPLLLSVSVAQGDPDAAAYSSKLYTLPNYPRRTWLMPTKAP